MNESQTLKEMHCAPSDDGAPSLVPEQIALLLRNVPGWSLAGDSRCIRREWRVKDFEAGLKFLDQVGQLSQDEDHHPDLHLEDFRNVALELTTHALGGLTENDFILAAKIDALPVELEA